MSPTHAKIGVRAGFDAAPMSPAQIIAVALTMLLSALDVFDVLAVTFAAPAISRGLGIGKVELGVVLSSGLAGMTLGSLLIARSPTASAQAAHAGQSGVDGGANGVVESCAGRVRAGDDAGAVNRKIDCRHANFVQFPGKYSFRRNSGCWL